MSVCDCAPGTCFSALGLHPNGLTALPLRIFFSFLQDWDMKCCPAGDESEEFCNTVHNNTRPVTQCSSSCLTPPHPTPHYSLRAAEPRSEITTQTVGHVILAPVSEPGGRVVLL